MNSAFFGRLVIAFLSVAVAAVTLSGQTSSQKTSPKKAPAKAESSDPGTSAGAMASSDLPKIKFEKYTLPNGLHVIASFHPSLQNTNTGRLTRPMFLAIFKRAQELAALVSPILSAVK